jgi:nucleoid-associated protein YgaU
LGKIAAKLLHNANRWHDIAKLNGIRDPNNLKVGRRLKIPA